VQTVVFVPSCEVLEVASAFGQALFDRADAGYSPVELANVRLKIGIVTQSHPRDSRHAHFTPFVVII
jgi:hypothetical protein